MNPLRSTNKRLSLLTINFWLVCVLSVFLGAILTNCSTFLPQSDSSPKAEKISSDVSKLIKEAEKKERAYGKIERYLKAEGPAHRFVLTPEGEFVAVFNPQIEGWIKKKWTLDDLQEIRTKLAPSLKVQLTPRGFVKAANRELQEGQEKDDTNYDAVWVRDSAWIYWNLQETDQTKEARTLLLSLWDYYSTAPQLARLRQVIHQPTLVKDKMAVPHIRFDGSSPELGDVMVKGEPEVWNHRQMDAHGLFILSIMNGFEKGLLRAEDISPSRIEAMALFPLFFEAVSYWKLEDAGAWEEVDRTNTSSISIVARAMMAWKAHLEKGQREVKLLSQKVEGIERKNGVQLKGLLNKLIEKGLERVRGQIAAEGESPIYNPYESPSLFRRADAALFNVLLPTPLPGLSEKELRFALASIEQLKRPAGVLRYQNDSYQSGNFWVQAPGTQKKEGTVGTTGDTSDQQAFATRLQALIPHTEAQWFFDNQLSMARLELRKLALRRGDKRQADKDLYFAQLHLKRALGQITGHWGDRKLLTADGAEVSDWQIPESINTVIVEGRVFYLPSPITPLNWAKASLEMTLHRMIKELR